MKRMKINLLKGVGHNAIDRIVCTPFRIQYWNKLIIPRKGEWVLDMKNKRSSIPMPFASEFYSWFEAEVIKARGTLDDIEKAEIRFYFDMDNVNRVTCEIAANGKAFTESRVLELW